MALHGGWLPWQSSSHARVKLVQVPLPLPYQTFVVLPRYCLICCKHSMSALAFHSSLHDVSTHALNIHLSLLLSFLVPPCPYSAGTQT